MTYRVFDASGTYTDGTDQTQVVLGSNVNLTDQAFKSDLIVDGPFDSVTAADDQISIYSESFSVIAIISAVLCKFYGAAGSDTITAAAFDADIYGGSGNDTVTLNGNHNSYFGGTGNDQITLYGSDNSVVAGSGNDTIELTGNNDSIIGGRGDMSVNLVVATGFDDTIVGGQGTNTLNIIDTVTDSHSFIFDLGAHTDGPYLALTFSNIQNVNYSISNPGPTTPRSAPSEFRLEFGSNHLDFTNSDGTNTVYNSGGSSTVRGGIGTDIVVGGTATTILVPTGGNDDLYGGSGTNILQPASNAYGTDRFFAGSGTNDFLGAGGTGVERMYGAGGTDYFQGGSGTNVLVEGTNVDEFHGASGIDYVYGSSSASKVYGGSGTDYIFTGASNQYFYSGTGKEYLYEEANNLTNGRLDIVDNFQPQTAGGKGTFIFEPAALAAATTFVGSNGGTYLVNPAIDNSNGTSDIFVPNVAPSIVKAQTYFNI